MTPGWLDDRAALARSQARSVAIGRDWVRDAGAWFGAAFAGVAPDDVEGCATAAERLFADAGWVGGLLAPLTGALRDDPAFVPPLRFRRDARRTDMVLHDGAHATISAGVLFADAPPPAATAVATGRLSVVRYCRAGGATLRRWDVPAEGACSPAPSVALADGMVLRLDGRVRAHAIGGATGDMVTLTATIAGGAAAAAREYAWGDGRLVRAAERSTEDSRTRMLLTLLRVSGRADAGARFEEVTRAASYSLRWAAMREWLALDARAALPRLAEMTGDPHAEVRAAARTTLAAVGGRLAA